jgi:hypothetical protein
MFLVQGIGRILIANIIRRLLSCPTTESQWFQGLCPYVTLLVALLVQKLASAHFELKRYMLPSVPAPIIVLTRLTLLLIQDAWPVKFCSFKALLERRLYVVSLVDILDSIMYASPPASRCIRGIATGTSDGQIRGHTELYICASKLV